MDMNAIGGALASLKAAYDITQAIKDVSDAAKVQGIIFDLQRHILDAQAMAIDAQRSQSTQIDEIRALKAEMADLKAWGAEKQNYELKAIDVGVFAYMLKPNMRSFEPAHWLCQNCYENGKKSVLQLQPGLAPGRRETFKCPRCNSTVGIHASTRPQ